MADSVSLKKMRPSSAYIDTYRLERLPAEELVLFAALNKSVGDGRAELRLDAILGEAAELSVEDRS